MVEKAKSTPGKRPPKEVEGPKRLCNGKLSDGNPCPKNAEDGKSFCRWHDPHDEGWREIYARLERSAPIEKIFIAFHMIEDHPEHRLELPEREGHKADLREINLKGIYLQFANLEGANLEDANLEGANLQNANLVGTDLQGAQLTGANLERAKLMYADFRRASLYRVNLESVVLYEAKLQGAFMADANLQGSFLTGANLERAMLLGCNLQEANLDNANFHEALLYRANLQGAQLDQTNLEGAHLESAKLQGVDLSTAKNLTDVYFDNAWLDRTRMRREQLGDAIGEERLSRGVDKPWPLDEFWRNLGTGESQPVPKKDNIDPQEEGVRNYGAAKRGYLALKQNFDDLGDYEAASWAYRRERRMEKLEASEMGQTAFKERKWREAASSYFKFSSDTLVESLCDYGESIWRVIGWIAVLLFVVGPLLFSALGGFIWDQNLAHDYFGLSSTWDKFWFSYRLHVLYSLGGLSVANFSGLQPANDAVKLASGFFSLTGIFLAGLLGFVAGNRIRRS